MSRFIGKFQINDFILVQVALNPENLNKHFRIYQQLYIRSLKFQPKCPSLIITEFCTRLKIVIFKKMERLDFPFIRTLIICFTQYMSISSCRHQWSGQNRPYSPPYQDLYLKVNLFKGGVTEATLILNSNRILYHANFILREPKNS